MLQELKGSGCTRVKGEQVRKHVFSCEKADDLTPSMKLRLLLANEILLGPFPLWGKNVICSWGERVGF